MEDQWQDGENKSVEETERRTEKTWTQTGRTLRKQKTKKKAVGMKDGMENQ